MVEFCQGLAELLFFGCPNWHCAYQVKIPINNHLPSLVPMYGLLLFLFLQINLAPLNPGILDLNVYVMRITLLILEIIIALAMKIPKNRDWIVNSLASFTPAVSIGRFESPLKAVALDFAIWNSRGKTSLLMWRTMYQAPRIADCLSGQVPFKPYTVKLWIKAYFE